MPRKGKETDPLVIYDNDQKDTAGSYKVDSENKVSFTEIGITKGNDAIDVDTIKEKLGNIRHNGSVHIFVHGDGLGKIVIKRKELSRKKLFSILANIVNKRPSLYPTKDITEVLLIACGGGNTDNDSVTYQSALDQARTDYPNSPIEGGINFVSPYNWYQFGNGSIKMYEGGEDGTPIRGTTVLLNSPLSKDRLKPNEYYYKTKLT